MRVWRAGVVVSLLVGLLLRPSDTGQTVTVHALAPAEQRSIAYMIVRIVIGLMYVWVALSVARAAARIFRGETEPEPDVYDLANAP